MNDSRHKGADMSKTTLLFVYGTLKRGCWNHDRFCRGALHTQEGVVRGRLYEMPSGIPVLQVSENDTLAVGTGDVSADVGVQKRLTPVLTSQRLEPPVNGKAVHGELFAFDDPVQRIPAIDRLEGFRPGQASMYRRVLTPVFTEAGVAAAWVYVTDSEQFLRSCRRLKDGRWEQESHVQ